MTTNTNTTNYMFKINSDVMKLVKGKVEKLAKEKKSLPVLSSVLVEVDQDEVTFTASNTNDTVQHSVSVEEGIVVRETGSFLLPAAALDTIGLLEDVEFRIEESHIIVTETPSAGSKRKSKEIKISRLIGEDEFPKFKNLNGDNEIRFNGLEFKSIVQKTLISVGTSEARPILTGVKFEFGAEQTLVSATDSHKLTKLELRGSSKDEMQIVVPASSLTNVLKSLDFTKDVVLTPSQNNLLIKNGATSYISRLLEGNYPDLTRLIPNEYQSKVVVNKGEMMNSLKLLKSTGQTQVTMDIDSMFVSLRSSGEVVAGAQEIAHEKWESQEEQFSIAYNLDFLMSMLGVMDADSVALEFTGSMRPFIVKDANDEDVENRTIDELHLLLPIRTNATQSA